MLLTATTGGQVASYNYDAFGRLDTVTSAGEVISSNTYDGYDRVAEHTKMNEDGTTETTAYTYDAMDRTQSRTDGAGTAEEETTDFSYLGMSSDVLSEDVAGDIQKSLSVFTVGEAVVAGYPQHRRNRGGRVLRVQPAYRR